MEDQQINCQHCGTPLRPDQRFCEACGQPVGYVGDTTPSETPVVVSVEQPPAAVAVSFDAPPAETDEHPTEELSLSPAQPVETPPESQAYRSPRITPPPPPPPPPFAASTPAKKRSNGLIISLIVLMVICLCCVCVVSVALGFYTLNPRGGRSEFIPNGPPSVATLIIETEEVQPPANETEAPIPIETAQPPAQEVAPPPGVSYQGVSFSYDPGLAQKVSTDTLPPVTGTDLPPWELAAETIQFTFEGYPLTGVFHTPRLQVFRADDYAAASPEGGKIVEELKKLLQDKPVESPDKELPFLPVPNAAQMMRAQIRYLDFRGGSGVRFLTQYGQDVSPISNTRMFYTYQGLTQDGQYIVSATFPVSNPVLPDESSITLDQAFMDRFAQYILDTTQALNGQPPESFTPDLGLLDTMIQTLQIQK